MATKYEVYILNQQMKPLAVLDTETFVRWTRRWQGCDDFELKINKKDSRVQYLVEDNILQIRRGSNEEFTCLIEHGGIELDENGRASENWEIRGTEITSRRICLPSAGQAHHEITGPAETVMKSLVNANLITAADTARRVSLLSVENDAGQGASLTVRARYQTLPAKLEEAALAGGVGWGVVGTSTGLQFRLIKGTDRSTAQAINPPIIFAPDFGNLEEMSYQWSNVGRPSIAYVAGQGEGASRTVREVFLGGVEPSGLTRREDFIDARDLSTTDALDDRGAAKLNEFGPKDRLEAKILNLGPFSYRDDWDLGDIVTVRNLEWALTAHMRVVEVTVAIDKGSVPRIDVAFGAPVGNFVEVVKKAIATSSVVQTTENPDVSTLATVSTAQTLSNKTFDTQVEIKSTGSHLKLTETDGPDPADFWLLESNGGVFNLYFRDTSSGLWIRAASFKANGDMVMDNGRSIWIGNDADSGDRLRLHHSSTEAFIDFGTSNLSFRGGAGPAAALLVKADKSSEFIGNVQMDAGLTVWNGTLTVNCGGKYLHMQPASPSNNSWGQNMGDWIGAEMYVCADSNYPRFRIHNGGRWYNSWKANGSWHALDGNEGAQSYVNVYAAGYPGTSDKRLKKNIKSLVTSQLEKVKKVQGYEFEWIGADREKDENDIPIPKDRKGKKFGFMAQEIQEVFPEVVSVADEKSGMLAVDYTKLVPVLFEAVKELSTQIDDLKAKLAQKEVI